MGCHIARAAPVYSAVFDHAGKRIQTPAVARLHDVDMAVEMNARPAGRPLAPGDDIDAGVRFTVARRTFGTDILDRESARLQPPADELRTRPICLSRRVHRRKANQLARQFGEFFASAFDGFEQVFRRVAGHGRRLSGTEMARAGDRRTLPSLLRQPRQA